MNFYNKIKTWWTDNIWTPQVKAELNPYGSCFSHAACWMLQNIEPEMFREYLTPDYMTEFVNSDEAKEYALSIFGAYTVKQYRGRLNELWAVQEWAINKLLASGGSDKRVRFSTVTDIFTVRHHLKKGPVIVSTAPQYNGRTLGHVMLVVGFENDMFIIDDPFGDFRDGYRFGNLDGGDDIHATPEQFKNILTNYSIYVV